MRIIASLTIIFAFMVGCTKADPVKLTDLPAPNFESEFSATYTFPPSTKTTPCSGSETVVGTINKCYAKVTGIEVSFANCAKLPAETTTYRSEEGTAYNVPMLCDGIECGTKNMQCNRGETSGPYVYTCKVGFHDNYLAGCDPDVKACSPQDLLDTSAVTGNQIWNGTFYGSCIPTACSPGRYLTTDIYNNYICEKVGLNYYSGTNSSRNACPAHSTTLTETSTSLNDCTCDRFYLKNDTTCSPIASSIPVVGNISGLTYDNGIYWDQGDGFAVTFTQDSSQRRIKIYEDQSCVAGAVGGIDFDAGETTVIMSSFTGEKTFYAQSENDAGQKSVCFELFISRRDTDAPALSFMDFDLNGYGYISANDHLGIGSQTIGSVSGVMAIAKFKDPDIDLFVSNADATTATISAVENSKIDINLGTQLYYGQLNVQVDSSAGVLSDKIGNLSSALSVTSISAGNAVYKMVGGKDFICVLLLSQKVRCFGDNTYGQIDPLSTDTTIWSPKEVDSGGRLAVDIAAGNEHLCIVYSNGEMKCQGRNTNMQLGATGGTVKTVEFTVSGAGFIKKVWAGGANTCIQKANKTTAGCFGSNLYHQMGRIDQLVASNNKTNHNTTHPIYLGGYDENFEVGQIYDIAIGDRNICAITNQFGTGKVICSGDNSYGQLGQGITQSLATLESSGNWGIFQEVDANGSSQLTYATKISAGANSICAIYGNSLRNLTCWGAESGDTINFNSVAGETFTYPTQILPNSSNRVAYPLDEVNSIYVSKNSDGICISTDLGACCWGGSYISGSGTVGNLTSSDILGTPNGTGVSGTRHIGLLQSITSVVSVRDNQCASNQDGSLACWGSWATTNNTSRPTSGTIGTCGVNSSYKCLSPVPYRY